jgi:hypothetical protein
MNANEAIRLDACQHCGCERFKLTFVQGKVQYRIVAKCEDCGRGRVVGLDAAYEAARPTGENEASTRRIRELFLEQGEPR